MAVAPSPFPTSSLLVLACFGASEGRFLFDFVHEEKLGPEELKEYSALVLPNIALLSDEQCRQLRAYVDGGGSLLATFESSLYTERNERRADFGLADVFGIHKAGDLAVAGAGMGNGYMARIEKQHEILDGLVGTNWIPGAECRVPLARVDDPVLTVVSGVVGYPPEFSYPPQSRTQEPAVVVRQKGNSRLAYFSGDIDRTLWRTGHTDHRGWIRNFYPIGAHKVIMKLPQGARVRRVELLRAEADLDAGGELPVAAGD